MLNIVVCISLSSLIGSTFFRINEIKSNLLLTLLYKKLIRKIYISMVFISILILAIMENLGMVKVIQNTQVYIFFIFLNAINNYYYKTTLNDNLKILTIGAVTLIQTYGLYLTTSKIEYFNQNISFMFLNITLVLLTVIFIGKYK